ncbi:SH3 domain-containing protein [Clostridium oryzae]|uniref:Bacterial SH3 domain protein n=1 Tax=Clostridium oryzae TaxID=1450648 RepID=A0A1V4IST6_9CLOT|nr:SH3 domain-containing protein [Clostridium oryzae]OPJ62880.1 bacterial SH3 domain protein [Clostridium oryzae]
MVKWKAVLSVLTILTSTLSISTLNVNAVTLPSISRDKAEKRALKIINLSWNYTAAKNSKINSKYAKNVMLPKQFQGVKKTEAKGIPYNWGGMDGVDTHSYNAPWTNFIDAVTKGAFTGNIDTDSRLGYISGTAGMDCSGFVQSVFDITGSRQSSSTLLNTYFEKINLDDIKHMDILDKPGTHVVIFDKWGTQNGVYGAFTYESTPDQTYGGIQGTKKYFMSLNTITKKGYIPGRYINITEDQNTEGKFKTGGYAIVSSANISADLRSTFNKNYKVLTTIPKSTALYLVSYSNGYYKVSYNNNIGWIKENVLVKVPKNKYVTVTGASGLNIRKNTTTKSEIVGILSENQYAEKITQSKDGNWYKVRVNGITGWCYAKYLTYLQ